MNQVRLPAFFKTKFFSFLFWLAIIVSISLTSFFLWQRFYSPTFQIPSTVQAVELPSGIKPQDLGHLNQQQQQQLDQAIALAIEKQFSAQPILKESKTTVIVLTQNNQPILPDLNPPPVTVPTTPATGTPLEPTASIGATPIPATVTPTNPPRATPTNIPCTDTDGGKDYYTKGTLTTSYGDTKTDLCTDPNIVGEYSCTAGASFAFDGYVCPGLCLDGACQPVPSPTATPVRTKPTKRPAPTATPTITPTPTNVPCVDTDGGKDIYTQGSVTTWGKTHFDTCYSLQGVGDQNECFGYFCRLLEFSCQPMGYQGEPFTCQYGCLNGACIKTPSPTPTSTSTPVPTVTPTSTSTPAPTATPTITPTPTLSPDQYELTFVYANDIEAKYHTSTGQNLNDDIHRIYQQVKKVFGPPRAPITVTVKYGPTSYGQLYSYYSASTNEMVLDEYDFHQLALIKKIILAFHDDLIYYMPFNWELALWNLTMQNVLAQLDPGYDGTTACPFCQLYSDSPAWATLYGDSWSPLSASTFSSLAADTLVKPFIEDPQFFAKFNQAIYRLPADWSLKTKLPAAAASIKPTVEGIPFNNWYATQYVLHFNPIPGKYIIPLPDTYSSSSVGLDIKLVQVKNNGSKINISNKTVTISAFDQQGSQFWSQQITTDTSGIAHLNSLPNQNNSFAARFHIYVPDFASQDFFYPYQDGQPLMPNTNPPLGFFGTINRPQGYLRFEDDNLVHDAVIVDGMFSTHYSFLQTRSTVEVSFIEPGINLPSDQTGSNPRKITKDIGDYYININLAGTRSSSGRGSSQDAPSAPAPTDFTCDTTNWHNYYSDNFEFEAKYPPGWDIQSAYTSDKIYQTRLSLVSTTDSASLLDHNTQHSFFDVIASTTDLKTDENYGRWFENSTGTQTTSQTEILDRQAEKYLDEPQMPGGPHRNIMYSFKEGKNYYLISLSYYITPELKTANEQLADCFLTTLNFRKPEPTPQGGIYKCSQGMYLTFEEKKQYPYSLPPGRCDNWNDKQIVCGHIRLVYDNNEMTDSRQEYPDACQFCADFDQSGQKGLRGTTFYNLGYTIGPCPN